MTAVEPADEGVAPHVPVTLDSDVAEEYVNTLVETGVTTDGVGQCFFDASEHDGPQYDENCLYTALDREYIFGASMSQDLAHTFNSDTGAFIENPSFRLHTGSMAEAKTVYDAVSTRRLPAPVEIVDWEITWLGASRQFRPMPGVIHRCIRFSSKCNGMGQETVTVTLEGEDSSDELEVPRTLVEMLSEEDETFTDVIGDLAMLSLAQQAHGVVHHSQGQVPEELEAAEALTMELFEERFGQSYGEVTGHQH